MLRIPKPRFNLKKPKSDKETLIFLVFNYRGRRLLYSTGFQIHPKDWDFKEQRPYERERRPDLWEIRNQLNVLNKLCKSIYIDSDYGVISVKQFKKLLDEQSGNTILEDKEVPTLLEFLDLEVDAMIEAGMKKASYDPYRRHAGILKKFAKAKGRFDYEDIDWNFRLELIDWLTKRNVQLSYGNKTLSILRQFMERARRKEYHTNLRYLGDGWIVTQKKAVSQKVTLNLEELQRMADLNLQGIEEKVRDLFLIGAGTGQRFSDYSRYKPTNFYTTYDGITLLSIISQKTDTPAKIPLNIFPWLTPTLEKYKYHSPQMSMVTFNRELKTVCQKAKIEGQVQKVEQYMGRKARIEKYFALKYKEVTSHCCRRSFATNLYRMGYKLGQIMLMTGHSSEKQLMDYIGINIEENARRIAQDFQ